jgi:hypothetical protein
MKKCVREQNNMKPWLMPIAKSWEAAFVFSIDVVFFFRCRFEQFMTGSKCCLCMGKISFRDAHLKVLRQIRGLLDQNQVERTHMDNAWHVVVIQSELPNQATCDIGIFEYA